MLIGSFIGTGLTWLWLGLAVVFAIVEALTLGIISIWFAIGALVAMLTTFLIDNFFIQLIIFITVSLILVFFTRKLAVENFKIGKEKTNVESLIGKKVVVTQAIIPYEVGEVKVDGTFWRAKSANGTTYAKGEVVSVLKIEGVTMIVE